MHILIRLRIRRSQDQFVQPLNIHLCKVNIPDQIEGTVILAGGLSESQRHISGCIRVHTPVLHITSHYIALHHITLHGRGWNACFLDDAHLLQFAMSGLNDVSVMESPPVHGIYTTEVYSIISTSIRVRARFCLVLQHTHSMRNKSHTYALHRCGMKIPSAPPFCYLCVLFKLNQTRQMRYR